jgi:hypothetical protein
MAQKELSPWDKSIKSLEGRIRRHEQEFKKTRKLHREVEAKLSGKIALERMQLHALKK